MDINAEFTRQMLESRMLEMDVQDVDLATESVRL